MRRLTIVAVCLACQDRVPDPRVGRLDRDVDKLLDRVDHLEHPEPIGHWWCAAAGCRRTRVDCDADEADLVRSSAQWPRPLVLERCQVQRVAWGDGAGRWLATLRDCQALATRADACVGVE